MRDSGYDVQPGPPRFWHLIAVSVCTGPEPSSPLVRPCLFVGPNQPPFSVTHHDFPVCMLVLWPSIDRMHASRFIPCVPSREDTHLSPTLASVFFCWSRSPTATVLSYRYHIGTRANCRIGVRISVGPLVRTSTLYTGISFTCRHRPLLKVSRRL